MAVDDINSLWSSLLIEELVRCGIRLFCSAPGSRSALLACAAARHPLARHGVHFDERALGFYAAGYSAATGEPVVIIVTSGTAVANLLPAVVEASKKKIPLILLTADRPPELQKTGAMQTIDQPGIFGAFVRASFDLPCPDFNISAQYVLTTVDQAVARATGGNYPGPVHMNCMFREPFNFQSQLLSGEAYLRSVPKWLTGRAPYTVYSRVTERPVDSHCVEACQRIALIRNGIIAVGKIKEKDVPAVLTFAEKTGWPVWPDITSGLRMGSGHPLVAPYFDRALVSAAFRSALKPDGIVHFGGRMTSKRFYEFAADYSGIEYISVLSHPLRSDPLHVVSLRIIFDVANFCESVVPQIDQRVLSASAVISSRGSLTAGEIISEKALDMSFTAAVIARTVSSLTPRAHALFLSNSMPVRDVDMFADHAGADMLIAANRGASGIDGIIASAAGYARGRNCPVSLLIGDLAFLHDLNSLFLLNDLFVPLTVVLFNNDGGGIFSHLPIAQEKDVFDSSFVLSHGLKFRDVARQFGVKYVAPAGMPDFIRSYKRALKRSSGATIIECRTSRELDRDWHRELEEKIVEKLSSHAFNV